MLSALTSRRHASALGKMRTTLVRRLSSWLKRSRAVGGADAPAVRLGKRVARVVGGIALAVGDVHGEDLALAVGAHALAHHLVGNADVLVARVDQLDALIVARLDDVQEKGLTDLRSLVRSVRSCPNHEILHQDLERLAKSAPSDLLEPALFSIRWLIECRFQAWRQRRNFGRVLSNQWPRRTHAVQDVFRVG